MSAVPREWTRRPATLVATGLLAVLCGCFREPVAPPDGSALETRLLGVWDCRPGEADATDRAQLAVFRFDERQYYAEWREDTKVDRYRAYPAKLGGVPVVSLQDLGDVSSGKPWTVLRSSFESDGSLAILSPARRILDMPDEAAALRELRSNASAPATWQPFARCGRHQD